MKIAFTLTDVQDLFLYGYLIDLYKKRNHSIYVYYDKISSKTTSVKKNKSILDKFKGCIVVPYSRQEDCVERLKIDDIDIVMTNEGMPFKYIVSLPCKMYAFSWTIEYMVHGHRFMPMCDVFFCDDPIVRSFNNFSEYSDMKVKDDSHPKYLWLNKSRNELCNMLDLDPKEKYVTVLGPAPALDYKPKRKEISKLVKHFSKKGFKIVYKHKPKDKIVKVCDYDKKISNSVYNCSTSVLLSSISDVVIGFNTSGIVESVHTRTPFINFFLKHNKVDYRKHWQFKINNDFILRLDSYDKVQVNDFLSKNQDLEKREEYPLDEKLDI